MLWVLKRTISMRRFFENLKQMFKLMGMKIITILVYKCPYYQTPVSFIFYRKTKLLKQLLMCYASGRKNLTVPNDDAFIALTL